MKLTAVIFAGLLFVTAAATLASAQTKPEDKAPAKAAEKTPEKAGDKAATAAKGDAKSDSKKKETATKTDEANLPKEVKKLISHDSSLGSGKIAIKGKKVKVNYTGWLYDPAKPMGRGQQFDTSVGREPFTFTLGAGEVIKGWDDGFENMKVGGKRKLIIPSELAYGRAGAGGVIPPNAPLMFEVELVDVL
jgi:FKBP-type peptidyl-prolyl cis-trans isomerase FkpA